MVFRFMIVLLPVLMRSTPIGVFGPISTIQLIHPLVPTPPFPGYPSGHATMGGMISEMYSYLFPAERASFRK